MYIYTLEKEDATLVSGSSTAEEIGETEFILVREVLWGLIWAFITQEWQIKPCERMRKAKEVFKDEMILSGNLYTSVTVFPANDRLRILDSTLVDWELMIFNCIAIYQGLNVTRNIRIPIK